MPSLEAIQCIINAVIVSNFVIFLSKNAAASRLWNEFHLPSDRIHLIRVFLQLQIPFRYMITDLLANTLVKSGGGVLPSAHFLINLKPQVELLKKLHLPFERKVLLLTVHFLPKRRAVIRPCKL